MLAITQPSDPCSVELRHERPVDAEEDLLPPLSKPGILVVDDEAMVRALLEVGLRQSGFTVWQAASGPEAVEFYRRRGNDISLVLLDVNMPGWTGLQTLAALQQLNPAICCCFMTGNTGLYTREQLLGLGAAQVFNKPFRLAEVGQLLWELVGG